jgi:hypothetical protein
MKRFVVAVCALVLAGMAGATAYAWHELASMPPFPPRDGEVATAEPTTPRTVYRSVAERAGGDERLPGARYGCAVVAAGRRYRCVVPGGGAGDRRYRVTVDGGACWTASRAGERATHGCLRARQASAD